MKKLKWILLIITIIMMAFFLFATCRKTKALESEINKTVITISERDQNKYNVVLLFDLATNDSTFSDFLFFYTTTPSTNNMLLYLTLLNNNTLRILNTVDNTTDTYTVTNRLLEIHIIEDTSNLYMVIYDIGFTYQQNTGLAPALDGITRTMLTRYLLPLSFYDVWSGYDLYITPAALFSYSSLPNYLINYSYITYSESANLPTNANQWVNNQLYNTSLVNRLYATAYNLGLTDGYDDGYDDGVSDGEQIGYDNGYDDGEQIGYNNGYGDGLTYGYDLGYASGYDDGYIDGENGESAVSKAVGVIGSIFGAVGTVLSIELFPGIPLGLFFLVPLFFAVLGLILWIWRRN